jgi:hypothetical protein
MIFVLCVVFNEWPVCFGHVLLKFDSEMKPVLKKPVSLICLNNLGGHKAVARPVPIPNTAVKHCLANGSGCIASARVGCRQFFQINQAGEFFLRPFLFLTIIQKG